MSEEPCHYTNTHGKQVCRSPIWSGSDHRFCLLHDPSPLKPEEEALQLLKKKIEAGDLNFEGSIFHGPVNLRDVVFLEFANFENCQFLGRETSFYKASFKKGVLFNQAVFRGSRVTFSRAQLSGDFNLFNNASFEATETHFNAAVFSGKHVGFASAVFSGNRLDFEGASFEGTVFFNRCEFRSHLSIFEKMQFHGQSISFSHSRFQGKEVKFSGALLTGEQADFSHCHFESDHTLFENCRFQSKKILFSNSFFKGRKVSFIQSEIDFEQLLFLHSYFNGREIDFSEVIFRGGTADFSNSHFEATSLKLYPIHLNNSTTRFTQSEFSGDEKAFYILNPQKNDLSFQGVFFHGGRTKLKGDLHAVSFIDTSLDNVDLNEAGWETVSGRLMCRDEIDANRANTTGHLRKAVDVCRNIKKCYESFGSYETAGDFYYGEMECRRKLSPKKNWGGLQFMRLTSGYGESPIRVIFTSVFVMFGCAFLYLLGGVNTPEGVIKLDSVSELSQFSKIIHDLLNCIYFSVVSFTTLGYGDYHPVGWSRVVGASEGFIGAFFMAMFVLTVGRKMNR